MWIPPTALIFAETYWSWLMIACGGLGTLTLSGLVRRARSIVGRELRLRRHGILRLRTRSLKKTKEIIAFLEPKFWAMENPATGLLKEREVVAGLPYVDVTYCSWGFPYKKPTRIWCSDPSLFRLPPPCCAATPCEEYRRERRHKQSAQRGPSRRGGVTRPSSEDTCSLDQLHSMPPGLCAAIAEAATRSLALH